MVGKTLRSTSAMREHPIGPVANPAATETRFSKHDAPPRRELWSSRRRLARARWIALLGALVICPGLGGQPAGAAAGGAAVQGDGLTAMGVKLDFPEPPYEAGDVISLANIFREDGITPADPSPPDRCPSNHLHGTIKIKDCKAGTFAGPFTDPFVTDPKNECGHGQLVPFRADVGIAVNGPIAALVGDIVTYTVTLTNNGPHTADTVDIVPSAMLNGSVIDTLPNVFQITTEGLDPTGGFFPIHGLPAGSSRMVKFSFQVRDTATSFLVPGRLALTFSSRTAAGCQAYAPGVLIDPNPANDTTSSSTSFVGIDPSTATDRFLNGLNMNALNRPADPAGLLLAENLLASGHTSVEVAAGILSSQEARQNFVQQVYGQLLRRPPNSGEIASSLTFLATGTREQFMAHLLGPEYFSFAGGANDEFVRQLFVDFLAREPASTELTALTNQLNSGMTTQQAALGLLTGAEYRQNLVQSLFQENLGRPASASELDTFLGVLNAGGTDEQVEGRIIALDEFSHHYPAYATYEGYTGPVIVGTFTSQNTASQPGDFTATINWGDATTSTGTLTAGGAPGSFFVSGSHPYPAPGFFTTSVQIVDKAGGTATLGNPVMVIDAPLFPVGPKIGAAPGVSSSGVVATFTDLNGNAQPSDYTATIDWGDGSQPSTGAVTLDGNPFMKLAPQAATVAFKATASHTYALAGDFAVTVQIADKAGSVVMAHSRAVVGPDFSLSFASPTVSAQPRTSASVDININRAGGFAGNVTVTPPPAANGIKPKPRGPQTAAPTDTSVSFKFKVGGGVSPGQYPLTFTAQDNSGRTRTGTVILVVQ